VFSSPGALLFQIDPTPYDAQVRTIEAQLKFQDLRLFARVTSLPMTTEYPALINRPKDINASALRPGMSGTATVYAPNSRPLDLIGWLLLYGRARALSVTATRKVLSRADQLQELPMKSFLMLLILIGASLHSTPAAAQTSKLRADRIQIS
jgi:hypothetical protein